MNDVHVARAFVARLERELPHCNCLMSVVCPDRGAAVRVIPKRGDTALTLQLDVSRLSDSGYVEQMLQVIRDQVSRG